MIQSHFINRISIYIYSEEDKFYMPGSFIKYLYAFVCVGRGGGEQGLCGNNYDITTMHEYSGVKLWQCGCIIQQLDSSRLIWMQVSQ